MANGISATNQVLLDLLANSLFDAKIDIDLSDISLQDLFLEAKAQTVLAVAFSALPKKSGETNPNLYQKWQIMSFAVAHESVKQMRANIEIEKLFKTAGLPVCTIKGFASDYYYSKKHVRQMGDIDFIVPIDRIEDGKKLLSQNEYICCDDEEEHDFHIGYKKNGNVFEMHKGITSFLDDEGKIEAFIGDAFENSMEVDISGEKLTIPDKFTHGLIMLLHMQRHMLDGGGVGLRHLCDWAVFVDAIDNDEWVTLFKEKLSNVKLWRFAQALSKTSSIFLKIKEKEWFSEIDDELATKLLQDMIIGGNFGGKSNERFQEVAYLSQTEKDKNVFVKYFKSYIKKVGLWKPFYRNHKVFLPIGMVAYFFRTSFLLIFGKKKMNFSKMHENTTKRNNLYGDIFGLK